MEEILWYKVIIDKRGNLEIYNNYYYFVFGYLLLCLYVKVFVINI